MRLFRFWVIAFEINIVFCLRFLIWSGTSPARTFGLILILSYPGIYRT